MRAVRRATRGAWCALFLILTPIVLSSEARAHGVMGGRTFGHPFVGDHAPVMNELMLHGHYMDHRERPDGWMGSWEIEKTITDGTSLFIEGGARFHAIPHDHGQVDGGHMHQDMAPSEVPAEGWADRIQGGDGHHDDPMDGGGMEDHDHEMHPREDMETPDGPDPRSGFDNLEVGLKHQIFTSERRETIVSLMALVEAPVGAERAGAEDHAAVGFHALLARGLGDLPRELSWIRPLAVQTDTGVEAPLGAGRPDTEMVANVALQYDLSVLHEHVTFPGWMERFVISTELNFETPLGGPQRGETETFVTAGLTWRAKQVQVGLAFQVPVEGGNDHRFVVMPMVSWFYDQTFPRLGRNLIH
jgi:hypothetical protein